MSENNTGWFYNKMGYKEGELPPTVQEQRSLFASVGSLGLGRASRSVLQTPDFFLSLRDSYCVSSYDQHSIANIAVSVIIHAKHPEIV